MAGCSFTEPRQHSVLEMKQAREQEDARREIGKKSQWAGNWTSASLRAFENVQRVCEQGKSFGSWTAVLQRDLLR